MKAVVAVVGRDSVGIIAKVSAGCAEYGANILDISQTVLNGFDLPCGWQVIGRTPVLLYDERREPASYCQSGQWVRFVPIDPAEYARIRALVLAGEYRPVTYEKGED